MLTRNELKYYSNFLNKSFRSQERKFLVEGKKLVEEGLSSKFECEVVIVTNEFADSGDVLLNGIAQRGIRFEIIKTNEFAKLSDTKSPQGICAVFSQTIKSQMSSYKSSIVVALEKINDPGNVGTIIRTCDWFGINEIILSNESADLFNPKVIRSTMGSIFHIPFLRHVNLYEELINYQKAGYKICVADLDGENVFDFQQNEKLVIVFGSESHGPSEEILNICDCKITIPKLGHAESLNVASAAAVILSQLTNN